MADPRVAPGATDLEAARRRLAAAQAELLTALTAGGPPPAGFDPERLRIQRQALAAKRAAVLGKVAPELPRIMGGAFRPAALAYALAHPLTGGYRQDAIAFVRRLLAAREVPDVAVRRQLRRWLRERTGSRRAFPAGWRPGRFAREKPRGRTRGR